MFILCSTNSTKKKEKRKTGIDNDIKFRAKFVKSLNDLACASAEKVISDKLNKWQELELKMATAKDEYIKSILERQFLAAKKDYEECKKRLNSNNHHSPMIF